jgi:nucleotide-binding universal stress UspA family protein
MTLVVGYVPTATGLSAIREAEREALSRKTDVLIVNIVGPLGYTVPTAADDRDLDAVRARLASAGVDCALRQVTDDKSPAEILLATAREVDAALIVLGLHQRSWLAKRVLGSTAREVVLAAPCPVLIVPDVDPPESGSVPDDGSDLKTPGLP